MLTAINSVDMLGKSIGFYTLFNYLSYFIKHIFMNYSCYVDIQVYSLSMFEFVAGLNIAAPLFAVGMLYYNSIVLIAWNP